MTEEEVEEEVKGWKNRALKAERALAEIDSQVRKALKEPNKETQREDVLSDT